MGIVIFSLLCPISSRSRSNCSKLKLIPSILPFIYQTKILSHFRYSSVFQHPLARLLQNLTVTPLFHIIFNIIYMNVWSQLQESLSNVNSIVSHYYVVWPKNENTLQKYDTQNVSGVRGVVILLTDQSQNVNFSRVSSWQIARHAKF